MLPKILRVGKQIQTRFINISLATVIGFSGLAAPLILSSGTAYAASKDITNVAQLRDAIETQADGQTWTIEAGNYGLSPFTDISAEGQTGWYLPIKANNITINGVGNPTIYGTGYTANGAWSTQNLMTIFGNNVTVNGLSLMPKVEPNKTIEVLGNDVTIENTVIEPNTLTNQTEYNNLSDQTEKDWGGSIYYNGAGGTQTLDNVTIDNGGVSYHAAAAGVHLVFTNVTLDYSTGADWINSYLYSSHFDNPAGSTLVGTPQVVYHVSSTLNNLTDVLANIQNGDTIELDSNITTASSVDIIKQITIDGQGHTISPVFTKTSSSNNAALEIAANNVTVKDLTIDGTAGTNLHGINTYEAAGVVLDNVTVKNNGHAAMIVNGSNVTATNFNTSNNTWGGVDVDPGSGVTTPSVFTLNSGTLAESNQIWSDGSNVSGSATVTVNASGYSPYYISDTGYTIWTNNLTNVASIKNGSTTTYYSTIQHAVAAASSGDTINVAPGTYNESVNISQPLTVAGSQAGVAGASTNGTQRTGSESTIKSLNINSNNVVINGFSFNDAGAQVNITSPSTLSGINIENNIFSGYSSVGMPTYDAGNLTIQNNYFTSPASNSEPMQIKASSVQGGCDGTTVKNNVFNFATNNGSADINFSCTGSNSSNITVSGNTDLGNTGGTSFVSFAGASDEIKVNNNIVTGMSGTAIFFWGGVSGSVNISNNSINNGAGNAISIQNIGSSYGANNGTFTVANNNLAGNHYGINVGNSALGSGGTVNAELNYWGDGVDPTTLVGSGVDVTPYFTNSTMTLRSDNKAAPDSSGNATANGATPEVVVSSPSQPLNITVTSGTSNATINFGSLGVTGGVVTVPQTTVHTDTADVTIPASTQISADDSSWNGVINAPKVVSVSVPSPAGTTTTVATAIEVGAGNINLTFNKAVRLLMPGQAGKLVGFVRNGNFTQIANACSADTQASGDTLVPGGDCYISVGADMVVWTKHFTTFVAYSQTATPSTPAATTTSSPSSTKKSTPQSSQSTTQDTTTPTVLGASSTTQAAQNNSATPKVTSALAIQPAGHGKILGLQWYLWLVGLTVLAGAAYGVYRFADTTERR